MTKERKLLESCLEELQHLPFPPTELIIELEELLAQPEEEPVAWKGKAYGNLHHVDYGNSIPLYTAPQKRKQEPINFDLDRMKLAVESPVSDVTAEELVRQIKSNRVFYQEGYAQAVLDLKREPLSDEDVLKIATKVCLEDMGIEMNPKDFKGTGVFELSRAIEKAHGITGGSDEFI